MSKGVWTVEVQRVMSIWDGMNPETVVQVDSDRGEYPVWAKSRDEAVREAIVWAMTPKEVTAARVLSVMSPV